jgi:two-component system sensor kinase FixL
MPVGMVVRREAKSPLAIATTAIVVCVAYYAGANLGFILRFPPSTPSIMWPPNAILTAVLLLTFPHRWWIYLLAALPAHLAAELGQAWPAPLVLALFVTNCSEALVAAIVVRWISDAPARFDTLRRVVSFVAAAVFMAPFLTSFLDAAAVTAVRAEAYRQVWRTRFLSNVLSELTIVPAVVLVITTGMVRLRSASLRWYAEATALAVGLLTVGVVVMTSPVKTITIPGAPVTPLGFLVPFILWAAVRFGPAGTSLSLLATALLAVWSATHARGPFTRLPLAESVVALQIFLTLVAIPLMCLAAVIEERRHTQQALAERLRFEELLSRLSGTLVHLHGEEVDAAFETALRQLGEFLRLDRLTLYRFSGDARECVLDCTWSAPGIGPVPRVTVVNQDSPWSVQQILREQLVVFSDPKELPAEAARDIETFKRRGIRSSLTVPLVAGGWIIGSLSMVTLNARREWPGELVERLQLVGEVFAHALDHRERVEALRASELLKSAILSSLSSGVAVLDREGRIITANESWTRFARGDTSGGVAVGANYLDAWRQAALENAPHAMEALAGIVAVLDKSRPSFALEYASGGDRWFALSVVPLNHPEAGAVVSQTDITERKRMELEAQRSRQELAHFTRVSTMGELTASLAHELSQPLTGILANARAAERFLATTPPDLGEVRAILTDIIEDDKRAGEVIQRLRDLLRKSEPRRALLDANTLVRDVVKLVSSDAIIRNVAVTLDLDPNLPVVTGDRVQLQQVILNLLINAMEASDGASTERPLVVRTERSGTQAVRVSVQDTGPGLRRGVQHLVFEPFYTTKPAGMGMGLAIARSIVDAHGGRIWATNNATGGATFSFDLPVALHQNDS